jgi:sialate O-acetylesterase
MDIARFGLGVLVAAAVAGAATASVDPVGAPPTVNVSKPIAFGSPGVAAAAAGAATASVDPVAPPPTLNVSNVFGSGMVLQRGGALLFGDAPAGAVVAVAVDGGAAAHGTADANAFWRVPVATPAGPPTAAHSLVVSCVSGCAGSATFTDVLFGDVFFCSGQSNMAFTLAEVFNASTEEAAANAPRYGAVRLFQVGDTGSGAAEPERRLPRIAQPWAPASAATVANFSAVCWMSGRDVFDGLGGAVPIGLIDSSVSGSPLQGWASPAVLAACADVRPAGDPYAGSDSRLFNAQVMPFAFGPLSLTAFYWWQGEANCAFNQTAWYRCAFPAFVKDWRAHFYAPTAYFSFSHLQQFSQYASPEHNDTYDVPWFRRDAQEVVLALPNTSTAPALDIGDPTSPMKNIHSRNKEPVGRRMAAATLHDVYGLINGTHAPPRFASASCGPGMTATVTLAGDAQTSAVALVTPVPCPTAQGVPPAVCSGFGIRGSDGVWYNATAAAGSDAMTVVLSADGAPAGVTPAMHGYAWSSWPQVAVYSADGAFPALPWLEAC